MQHDNTHTETAVQGNGPRLVRSRERRDRPRYYRGHGLLTNLHPSHRFAVSLIVLTFGCAMEMSQHSGVNDPVVIGSVAPQSIFDQSPIRTVMVWSDSPVATEALRNLLLKNQIDVVPMNRLEDMLERQPLPADKGSREGALLQMAADVGAQGVILADVTITPREYYGPPSKNLPRALYDCRVDVKSVTVDGQHLLWSGSAGYRDPIAIPDEPLIGYLASRAASRASCDVEHGYRWDLEHGCMAHPAGTGR